MCNSSVTADYCKLFNCDKRRGSYCCWYCDLRAACKKPCFNSPDKCGLHREGLRKMGRPIDAHVYYSDPMNEKNYYHFNQMEYVKATADMAEHVIIPITHKGGDYLTACGVMVTLLEAGIKKFLCRNTDEVLLSNMQALAVMLFVKEQREEIRGVGAKSLAGWRESGLNVEDYLLVGDTVDEEMVDYFRNILPPLRDGRVLQPEEPYSCEPDELGRYRNTYITFAQRGSGWYYAGLCFAGDTVNRTAYKSTLDRQIDVLKASLAAQNAEPETA